MDLKFWTNPELPSTKADSQMFCPTELPSVFGPRNDAFRDRDVHEYQAVVMVHRQSSIAKADEYHGPFSC